MPTSRHVQALAAIAERALGRECRLTRGSGLVVYGTVVGVHPSGRAIVWNDRGALARSAHVIALDAVASLEILGQPGTPRGTVAP